MADNNEPTLRNALDAVNTSRKWALLGIGSMCFCRRAPAVHVVHDGHSGAAAAGGGGRCQRATRDIHRNTVRRSNLAINRVMPLKVLWVSSAIQLLFVACATGVLMLHVSRLTRAVLRAIESTRR